MNNSLTHCYTETNGTEIRILSQQALIENRKARRNISFSRSVQTEAGVTRRKNRKQNVNKFNQKFTRKSIVQPIRRPPNSEAHHHHSPHHLRNASNCSVHPSNSNSQQTRGPVTDTPTLIRTTTWSHIIIGKRIPASIQIGIVHYARIMVRWTGCVVLPKRQLQISDSASNPSDISP